MQNKFPRGVCPRTPLEACSFGARLGNRSVFFLDPRLVLDLYLRGLQLSVMKGSTHNLFISISFSATFFSVTLNYP